MRRSLTSYLLAAAAVIAPPAEAVDVRKCAMVSDGRAQIVSFPARMADGAHVTVSGLLATPDPATRLPTLIMLPGGRGLRTPYCYGVLVEQFARWGLATLIVASTTAVEADGTLRSDYSFADQASHAAGAVAMLAHDRRVDPARIALWGFSLGGLTAIDLAPRPPASPGPRARAIVASSPVCPARPGRPAVPLLVTIGDADRDVNVETCERLAERLGGAPGFEFMLIPGAEHLYWAPGAPAYDADAASRVAARTRAFLARHLDLPR